MREKEGEVNLYHVRVCLFSLISHEMGSFTYHNMGFTDVLLVIAMHTSIILSENEILGNSARSVITVIQAFFSF